ncbi:MAG: hypothetical protein EBX52_00565 [Proteobacteria bacterium]|nr:hypothetical protein [Pseudomonadota bacterium]
MVEQTIRSDLEFTDQFRFLPEAGLPKKQITGTSDLSYPDWAKAGVDYLGWGAFSVESGKLAYEFHLAGIGANKELIGKRYLSEQSNPKTLAHAIASDIMNAVTGKKGIFNTRIAFVCDLSGKKEIYTSAFDGSDLRQVTRLRSLSMAPAWSPDGGKIGFSVYNRHSDGNKNLDLYEYDLGTGKVSLLSNRKGINSGVAYSPDGKKIAYTMSYTGNPEIHLLDLSSREATQLTRSIGFDVDPAFSPDGKSLAFVSSRPGKPMIYLMDLAHPLEPKRLTYAGSYNATPNWSPDGKKIIFAGWLDQHFDLFTITADGGRIDRLSKNEGNNEDPFYSPDGNFIVFSSSRSGGKNIFVMNAEGGNLHRITFGLGSCVAPKWSPYLE